MIESGLPVILTAIKVPRKLQEMIEAAARKEGCSKEWIVVVATAKLTADARRAMRRRGSGLVVRRARVRAWKERLPARNAGEDPSATTVIGVPSGFHERIEFLAVKRRTTRMRVILRAMAKVAQRCLACPDQEVSEVGLRESLEEPGSHCWIMVEPAANLLRDRLRSGLPRALAAEAEAQGAGAPRPLRGPRYYRHEDAEKTEEDRATVEA